MLIRRRKNLTRDLTIIAVFSTLLYAIGGCKSGSKKGPNIQKVKLELPVDHFEKDFFSLDTNNLDVALAHLKAHYGHFYEDFLYNIATISMDKEETPSRVRLFINKHRFICDSVDYYIPQLNQQLKEIEKAFKRARIYFPDLSLPAKVITYIGPIDGYGSFVSKEGLGVGLQQFFGPRFSGYQAQIDYLLSLFGAQRLHQFTPDYIASAAISCWVNREFPDKAGHFTLNDKVIEEGKKVYVLKSLLPDLPDSVIFGYSGIQMTWCKNNSILIKRYFEHENLLETKRPEQILTYISDNLRPDSLPVQFPNNIGKYLGFLMVKNYMEAHRKTSLPALMKMPHLTN